LKFAPSDAKTPTWVFPATNLLLFGPETSRLEGLNDRKAGVWLMPVSQLDSGISSGAGVVPNGMRSGASQ